MSQANRGSLGSAYMVSREPSPNEESRGRSATVNAVGTEELRSTLADVKGQAQFLLYLADQIEESLEQLDHETDACHGAFLCKVLSMYSTQLESKHHGLGEKIAETCQELYVTVREFEIA